jgi:VWFA-related protein
MTRRWKAGTNPVTRALLVLALASIFGPLATSSGSEEEFEVLLMMPTYGEAVFGEVEVTAEVYPPEAEVDRVEFYLDGELVGIADRRPFTLRIDAGQENIEHAFEAQAYIAGGSIARTRVETPRITTNEEISVDLQQLYVTVAHPDGQRALDLEREDFAVFDNSERQQLVTFERGDVPFTAVLLVDASSSMRGRQLQIALEGADTFIRGMRELDQAKLMLVSDRVLYETPFTSFASVLNVGLTAAEAAGGTTLNDNLYLAMKRLEERQGRRVVVILSDGIDVESVLGMEEVRWLARQKQPVIYWIRLEAKAERRSTWRSVVEHRREIESFEAAVVESGGRIETLESIDEVEDAFQWILDDLRNQYVLGYYPETTAGDENWHRILVRVRDNRLDVRTRGGYLEPTRWTRQRK